MKEDFNEARRNAETLREFFEAVAKFGFDDFFSFERPNQPHRLQAVSAADDNYLHRLFTHARRILEKTYAYERGPASLWSAYLPGVENVISAKGPETRVAFGTLFTLCRAFEISVQNTPSSPAGRQITRESHALSDADAAQMRDALKTIWAAYPQTNPYILEGAGYVMSSTPFMKMAFPRFWWPDNEQRSDHRIAQRLEETPVRDRWGSEISAGDAAAIARQSAENLLALRPHGPAIARQVLAWCLSRTLDLDADYRDFTKSRKTAQHILALIRAKPEYLDIGADYIRRGICFGSLRGHCSWSHREDEDRINARKSAAFARQYLELALNVESGVWFDRESEKLLKLAEKVAPAPTEMPAGPKTVPVKEADPRKTPPSPAALLKQQLLKDAAAKAARFP